MLELVTENIDGAVVCVMKNPCDLNSYSCSECADQIPHVHNWLKKTELQYLIVDFQDEKDVCPNFLVGLLHLRKRLRFPFLFAGVYEGPRKILSDYAYREFPIFVSPEDAVRALRMSHPALTEVPMEKIEFNALVCGFQGRAKEEGEEEVEEDEI